MFDRPKMGYVRTKIGLIGQFDRRQLGNYLQPCCTDHNNYNTGSGRVSMSTDWVDMLGILDFLEFDGRFL